MKEDIKTKVFKPSLASKITFSDFLSLYHFFLKRKYSKHYNFPFDVGSK
jgi:hypothetical protein